MLEYHLDKVVIVKKLYLAVEQRNYIKFFHIIIFRFVATDHLFHSVEVMAIAQSHCQDFVLSFEKVMLNVRRTSQRSISLISVSY